mgnify:CR=1 FL=1
MIGVPLSDGKTLNVTFRSLNTRFDIFKTSKDRDAHSLGAPASSVLSATKTAGQSHRRRVMDFPSDGLALTYGPSYFGTSSSIHQVKKAHRASIDPMALT